jgi:hypothetical protein
MNAFIFGSAIEVLTGLSGFLAFFAAATIGRLRHSKLRRGAL